MRSMILAAAVAATSTWAFTAQDQDSRADAGLVRVQDGSAGDLGDLFGARDEPRSARSWDDKRSWDQRLTDLDFDARMQGFEALVSESRGDPGAPAILQDWIEQEGSGELGWTYRLVLRDLARSPARAPEAQRPFGLQPFAGLDAFDRGVDSWLREFLQGADPFGGLPQRGSRQSQSLRMEQGPDGVRVFIDEDVDGKSELREYEADSLEELLEANPELRDRIRMQDRLQTGGLDDVNQLLERLRSEFGHSELPRQRHPVRTDILGVMVREDAQEGSKGLRVESVVPGTIAAELGVRAGEQLLRLGGQELQSSADIAGVLRSRKGGASLTLESIGADGERHRRTWTPPTGG